MVITILNVLLIVALLVVINTPPLPIAWQPSFLISIGLSVIILLCSIVFGIYRRVRY